MQKTFRQWLHRWRSLIPTPCPLCGLASHAGALCPPCERDCFGHRHSKVLCIRCALAFHDLEPNPSDCSENASQLPICNECQGVTSPVDRCASALDYAFPGKLLVLDFKQRGRLSLAPLLAQLMWRAFTPLCQTGQVDAWVPVPATTRRLLQSGFNPAQQLAWWLSRTSGFACRLSWLTRVRDTPQQKSASRVERAALLSGAFVASPEVAGRSIGLVDDVMTTGATVGEAALTFKAAGAREVAVLTAARTPPLWHNRDHV